MNIKHVTAAEFQSMVVDSKKITLVDFFAEWCGPCKRIAVVLEEMAKNNPQVQFLKVDVDTEADLASAYNISSIPTLILFKEGKPVNQLIGAVSKEDLENLIA